MTPEQIKMIRDVPVPEGEKLNLSWTAPICVGTMFELLDEIESLTKERDRYRKALEEFADYDNPNEPDYVCSPKSEYMKLARDALRSIRGET